MIFPKQMAMLNNPPIKTHPCCLKNLRQALPDGPRPETLSIVFNEWLGLFLLGKKETWCYWCKLTSTCAASYLPDLGGSLSWLTNNVHVFVALQQTAWSKRCTSAFSSGPGRDADVFSADSVHVHCLDKLKCSVYFNFIDNVDKLAKVI